MCQPLSLPLSKPRALRLPWELVASDGGRTESSQNWGRGVTGRNWGLESGPEDWPASWV